MSHKFRASTHVTSKKMGGEYVLMDLETGTYFSLDPVGGRIWELFIERPRALSEIRDSLVEEFDVAPAVVEQDLIALAEELIGRRLLIQDCDP